MANKEPTKTEQEISPNAFRDALIAFVKSLNTNGRSQTQIANELRDLVIVHHPTLDQNAFTIVE